ncbi:MAG: hypothetical protein ABI042_05630 [Verrucomicrobiota bacterium]
MPKYFPAIDSLSAGWFRWTLVNTQQAIARIFGGWKSFNEG